MSCIFSERNSLFHTRYKCLNLRKREDEDFISFAENVNQECERFNLMDLSIHMFKCLVFVQGLTANRDKDIRSRILNKMEQGPNITLKKITECQHMLNIKHDNSTIEEKDISHVHALRPKLKSAKDYTKPSPCYGCGGLHFKKTYFKNKKCFRVIFLGYKSMHCRRKNKNLEKNGTFKNKYLLDYLPLARNGFPHTIPL